MGSIVHSQWFVRIYRTMYIIYRILYVEHSFRRISRTLFALSFSLSAFPHTHTHAYSCNDARITHRQTRRSIRGAHALVNPILDPWIDLAHRFLVLLLVSNIVWRLYNARITHSIPIRISYVDFWKLHFSLARLVKWKSIPSFVGKINFKNIHIYSHIWVIQKLMKWIELQLESYRIITIFF